MAKRCVDVRLLGTRGPFKGKRSRVTVEYDESKVLEAVDDIVRAGVADITKHLFSGESTTNQFHTMLSLGNGDWTDRMIEVKLTQEEL